jgi:DNA uptake protein ComE-like DNA-binding protein
MSFKTLITAALLAAAASTAIAQTAQQPPQPAPRPAAPAQPAQPAAPAQPARPAAAQPAQPAAQPARPAAAPAAPAAAPAAQRPAAGQVVNLNTATKDQLETLPQIGPARAQAIIDKRPYRDWNDFVAKNVVPANAEREIQNLVRFR